MTPLLPGQLPPPPRRRRRRRATTDAGAGAVASIVSARRAQTTTTTTVVLVAILLSSALVAAASFPVAATDRPSVMRQQPRPFSVLRQQTKLQRLPQKQRSETTQLSDASAAAAAVPAADDLPRGGGDAGAEADDATSVGTASIPNEVFNLIKSIVGAGVLSLPWGVAFFGNAPAALFPATALIVVSGLLSAYTFGLIGRLCQRTGTSSYAAAWDETVGRRFSFLVAFACFFDCVAGNLSYSMILADTVQNLFKTAGFASVTRTQSLLGVTGTLLLPLCLLRNLSSLAPVSLLGIAGMMYTTVVMGLRWAGGQYRAGGAFFESQLAEPVFGTAGAAAAVSPKSLILTAMLANAYIAHFNAPNFLRELKNPTMTRYHQVIAWSFGASISLYCVATAFGFLTFGAASNGLILNNYSAKDALASASRAAVAVSVIGSYPLLFAGVRDGLLDLFRVPERKRGRLFSRLTVGVLAAVTLLAAKVTDLGLVSSVGGATFGTALTFIFPAIMFVKASGENKNAEYYLAGTVGVLGVLLSAVGTVLALRGN